MAPAPKKCSKKRKTKKKSIAKNYKKKTNLNVNEKKKENGRTTNLSSNTTNNYSKSKVEQNNISDKDFALKCDWEKCYEEFPDKQELFDHVSKHICNLKVLHDKYSCLWSKCFFETSNNNEIARHIHYHAYHTSLMLEGKKAAKDLNIPNCTYSSEKLNIPEFDMDFVCRWSGCNKSFISIILFFSHVKKHCDFEFVCSKLPSKKKPIVPCGWENCTKEFSVKYRFHEHIIKHTNEKSIGCHICYGIFRTKTYFIDHCTRQEANNTQEFQCSQCFKYFSTEKLLTLHITLHVNRFKCSKCDMTCNSGFTLASHIRYRHMHQKPFKCSFCEQKYVTKNDLKRHVLMMHENFTYKCTQTGCNYVAKSTYRLGKHFTEIHKNQHIIYACHCCDMVYNCGGYLSKHLIRKHSFQLPSGHKRFTYCVDENGIYRLQTKRTESLDVILSPKHLVLTDINFNKSSVLNRNEENSVDDFFTIENVEINIGESCN